MKQVPGSVRVIVDSRDGSQDYFIPLEEARKLYNKGELLYDLTNLCYCHGTKSTKIHQS